MKSWMFKKINTAATVTLLISLLAGCSPESKKSSSYTGSVNPRIFGGVEADQKFQSENGVVGLFVIMKDKSNQFGVAICSGTLIDKKIILTATHCIAGDGNSQVVAVGVSFKPDFQNVLENWGQMSEADFEKAGLIFVDNVAANPNYMKNIKSESDYLNPNITWDDIALLRLSKDAPTEFKIAKLPTKEDIQLLKTNSELFLAGFGMNSAIANKAVVNPKTGERDVVPVGEKNPSSGVLRKANKKVVTHITADNKEFSIESSKSGSCHGDSGGPAFLTKADGTTIQVGVADRTRTLIPEDNIGNCNELMTYTGVIGHMDWIMPAMQQLLTAKVETAPAHHATTAKP